MHNIRCPRTSGCGASDDTAPSQLRSEHQSPEGQNSGSAPKRSFFWDDPDAVKRVPLRAFDPFQEPLLIPQSFHKRRRHGFDANLLGPGLGLAIPRPCRPHASGEACVPETLSRVTADHPPSRSVRGNGQSHNDGISSTTLADPGVRYNVRRPGSGRPRKASDDQNTQGAQPSQSASAGFRRPRTSQGSNSTQSGNYVAASGTARNTSAFQVPSAEDFETLARAVISLPDTMEIFQGEWHRQMDELRRDRDMLIARVDDLDRVVESGRSDPMLDTFKEFRVEINERFKTIEAAAEEITVGA